MVGYAFFYLPIFLMSIIASNRREIKKVKWTKRCGMLTEELGHKNLMQLYYYPLFLYERMLIAGIIVYMQSWPSF